ncbi:hypothetical protein OIO90_006625 [Microbotryomycetes sp. JL221]|nr:hypothetical protein OIO90_006625 [Microbotryomycetes sp. JL221]
MSASPFFDSANKICIPCPASTPVFSGGVCVLCPANGICDGSAKVVCDAASSTPFYDVYCPGPATNDPRTPAGIRVTVRDGRFGDTARFGPSINSADYPTYVATLLIQGGAHPGNVRAGRGSAPYGGSETFRDTLDVLPITSDMQWVDAFYGYVPNCKPIIGGYESNGQVLYHAMAQFDDIWIAGKTAPHLYGANFPYDGYEARRSGNYKFLCWK